MRAKLKLLTITALTALPVNAGVAAEREFRGFAQIISGPGCDSGIVGRDLLARFLPAGVADNGNTTDIGLFGQSFAQGYHLNSGFYTTSIKDGTLTHVGSRFGDGANNPVQMRKVGNTPDPDRNTVDIVMTIDIRGYDFQQNCTARLRLVLTRDVDQ